MSTEWSFEVERQFCALVVDFFITSLEEEWFRTVYDIDYSCHYYKIVRGREYWREVDYNAFHDLLEDLYNKDPDFLAKYIRNTVKVCDQLEEATNKLALQNWSTASAEVLLQSWNSFCNPMLEVASAINMLQDEFIESHVRPTLEQMRTRLGWSESVDKILAIINNGDKPLAYRDEPLTLLRIGATIQQDTDVLKYFDRNNLPETVLAQLPNKFVELIDSHRKKYSWLNHPYAVRRNPFTNLDYVQRLQHLVNRSDCGSEIERIENLRAEDRSRFEKILNAAQNSKEAGIVQAARDFAFIRTHLAEVFDYALVTVRETILAQVCQIVNIVDHQIVSMTVQEIRDCITKQHLTGTIDELDSRANGYAYILEGESKMIVSGEDIIKYEEEIQEDDQEIPLKATSVSGMVANPGMITGVCKILESPEDNWKVNAGDIIIATMTTPEYISAMEKASAFITDEGGITCHAAITSREFGVPCIVGTQIATQVFHDNDVVRVDANSGVIVRI